MNKQAFVIRCSPNGISRIDELLPLNQIVIGWSLTEDRLLRMNSTWEDYKTIIKDAYPWYSSNPNSLSQCVGYLWRFIKDMHIGDYVLVPISGAFYLAEIKSDAYYLPDKVSESTAIRRNVEWLNNEKPISRGYCDAGLTSRLKYHGTCVNATDLIDSIERALKNCQDHRMPQIKDELSNLLKTQVKDYLTSPKSSLNPEKFAKIIELILQSLGAKTKIPSKQTYSNSIADVDIVASFEQIGIQIFVQAKHHTNETDEHAIKQLVEALHIFDSSVVSNLSQPVICWAVTSGSFSPQAIILAEKHNIRCIEGDELSEMILSVGLDKFNNIM